jgi:hypothetical protein
LPLLPHKVLSALEGARTSKQESKEL